MRGAVDRHAAFETNSHTADGTAQFSGDRSSKTGNAEIGYRGGDGRSFFNAGRCLVDGECDQCSVIVRVGR